MLPLASVLFDEVRSEDFVWCSAQSNSFGGKDESIWKGEALPAAAGTEDLGTAGASVSAGRYAAGRASRTAPREAPTAPPRATAATLE